MEPEPFKHAEGTRPHFEGLGLCGQGYPKSCLSGSGVGDPQATNIWTYQRRGGSPQSKCLPKVSGGQTSHKADPTSTIHCSCDLEARGLGPLPSWPGVNFQLPGQARSQIFGPYSMILSGDPERLTQWCALCWPEDSSRPCLLGHTHAYSTHIPCIHMDTCTQPLGLQNACAFPFTAPIQNPRCGCI